jgi:predicted GNAT family N-acyltransferase
MTGTPRRIHTLTHSQIEDLYRLYQNEWWTRHRTLEDTRRMLDQARVIAAFADPRTERLIAFARAITDGTFKAVVFDVIVDPAYRKSGLGKTLMDAIVSHPELASVAHIELYCKPELIPFYERWGFKEAAEVRFLRRSR